MASHYSSAHNARPATPTSPTSRSRAVLIFLPLLALFGCTQAHHALPIDGPTQTPTQAMPAMATIAAPPTRTTIATTPTAAPLVVEDVTTALYARCAEQNWMPHDACRVRPFPSIQVIVDAYSSFNHAESLCDTLTGGQYGIDLTRPSGSHREPVGGGTFNLLRMTVTDTTVTCTYERSTTTTTAVSGVDSQVLAFCKGLQGTVDPAARTCTYAQASSAVPAFCGPGGFAWKLIAEHLCQTSFSDITAHLDNIKRQGATQVARYALLGTPTPRPTAWPTLSPAQVASIAATEAAGHAGCTRTEALTPTSRCSGDE